MEEEKIYREKVFKTGAISIGVCLLIAYWYATQGVATDCGYSEILGGCLSIGSVHIYPPYRFYFWQENEVLKASIPEIIGSYAAYPYLGFLIGAGFTYFCAKGMKVETSHGSAAFATAKEIDETIDWSGDDDDEENPFHILLTHPKVAECAANMLNDAEQTRASIMQTAQTALALYQNPVVQKNTDVSDFCIKDLLSPKNAVSLYLCMHSNEVQTLKPLSRLLINTMLHKLIRDIKFDTSGGEMKQRLLLMLDEFPQLGNLKSMELALAVCAGYGIKVCIVAQDVNQLNKEYTKDNSIASNCHVHIYFTPNLDSGAATAESISKNLGKKTIKTVRGCW